MIMIYRLVRTTPHSLSKRSTSTVLNHQKLGLITGIAAQNVYKHQKHDGRGWKIKTPDEFAECSSLEHLGVVRTSRPDQCPFPKIAYGYESEYRGLYWWCHDLRIVLTKLMDRSYHSILYNVFVQVMSFYYSWGSVRTDSYALISNPPSTFPLPL